MPWSVVRRGSKYCVRADKDGATVACHDTARQARQHQQALYANEPQARLKRKFQRNVGGGVDRDKLDSSDFVLGDERTFPIVKPGDVQDAVSSWGRYRGPTSFEEFQRRLTALARRKGPEFVAQLPKAWETEEKAKEEEEEGVTVKAEAGDDNKRSRGGVGYGARAGQTIRGRLVRGSDGKFSSSGAPSSSSSATPKRGPTLRQRLAAQRSAARQQRRAAAKKPAAAGRGGGKSEAQREAERQRKRLEQEADREKRRAAAEADRQKRRAEQEADRKKREAERAARAGAKPAKAGGGGGKGGAEKPDASQAKRDNRRKVENALAKAGLGREDYDALSDFYDGEEVTPARLAGLVAQGLAVQDSSGGYRLTPAARGLMQAAGAGNVRRAVDALSSGRDRARREAERAARRRKEAGGLVIFKQFDGLYRWVAFSSNAYLDRDGEILSTKALEDDCARADELGEYGPLRWWHVAGLELGNCDYNAMSGRVLVESGTFVNEAVGAAIAAKSDRLQMSIGFFHPPDEPDTQGVFHNVIRFERSLVPMGRAANPWTRLTVTGKEAEEDMLREIEAKWKALVGLLGEEQATAIAAQAEATQKALDEAGVTFKADDGPAVADEAMIEDEAKADGEMDEEAPDELLIGDMTPNEFTAMLSESLAGALAPLLEAVNVESKMAAHLGELKDMLGGYAKKKDDEAADQAGQVTALQEALKEMKEAHERQAAEQRAAHAQQVAGLEAQIQQAAAGVAELKGETPRGLKGYRASEDAETVVGEGHRLKDAMPQADTFDWFLDVPVGQ